MLFVRIKLNKDTPKGSAALLIAASVLLSFALSVLMVAVVLGIVNWVWDTPTWLSFSFKHILGIAVLVFAFGLVGGGSK